MSPQIPGQNHPHVSSQPAKDLPLTFSCWSFCRAESVTTPMRSLDPLIVVKSSFQVVERPRAFPRPAPPFHPPDSSREPTLPETVEPVDEAGSTPCVRVRVGPQTSGSEPSRASDLLVVCFQAEDHQQSVADTSTRGRLVVQPVRFTQVLRFRDKQ